MKKIKLNTAVKKQLADRITPVSLYLNLRDRYADAVLLESSDYRANDNSFSYICCEPIARFEVLGATISQTFPSGEEQQTQAKEHGDVVQALYQFSQSFQAEETAYKFISNGLFGYTAYDAVRHFETLELQTKTPKKERIPEICYQAYRFVVAINHFNNELYLFEHRLEGTESRLDNFVDEIRQTTANDYPFKTQGDESSNQTDEDFLRILRKGKEHCQLGDVFQIVLSRRFEQAFKGDEFNVYRALRSINPSPYLFYFDYGSYKIFGSSPEAQIVIQGDKASIHPIAGTFKRTGDDKADAELAKQLAADPKETAEHVMLVDLARNDLSRHGHNVEVETFKEIQYFSHVIHLVSKVTGDVQSANPLQLVADTFPAGTLSGAPKYRAMQLIDEYEPTSRGYYGGCIGFMGFNGSFNQAIMIRSFFSKNNVLHYQAGAGVVFKSDPQSELEEVNNKLRALRKAIEFAETIA